MGHRCAEPMELAALVALPADDPRRLDAMACPRCDSLLRAMDAFLEGDASLPADESARAERLLAASLPAQRPQAPATPPFRPVRARRRPATRWGWGVGLAATVALMVFVGVPRVLRPTGPSGVLRGGAAATALDLPVRWAIDADGVRVRLSWPAVAGAQRYELELYSAALDTIGIFTAASGPAVTVDKAAFGPEGPSGALARVRALRAAGEPGVSRLAPLQAR